MSSNSISSGTPSATVVDVPKLDLMSLRTIPLSVRTLTPLLPSPGNGPPVSCGISVVAASIGTVVVGVDAAARRVVTISDPATAASPAPPARVSS